MTLREADCVWKAGATLGEGPLWSVREQALYWVDILGHRLFRYDPKTERRAEWAFGEPICAVAERAGSAGLIVTVRHGFAFFDPVTGNLTRLHQPEPDMPGNRFNDGKCDAEGRFWAGTMDFGCTAPTGSLYRYDPDGRCTRIDSGYPVTNGPAFSVDGRTLYHNDTIRGITYAFDLSAKTGEVSNKRVFLEHPTEGGKPDGMTVDADNGLWIAFFGGSCVRRYAPDGQQTDQVNLPASQITSCAFGGPHLRTLYVTSATVGLGPDDLAREPLAGGLFRIDLDQQGLPANRYAG